MIRIIISTFQHQINYSDHHISSTTTNECLFILFKEEQVEQALEEMKTKTKWGRWTLDTEVLPSLDICPYPANNAKVTSLLSTPVVSFLRSPRG